MDPQQQHPAITSKTTLAKINEWRADIMHFKAQHASAVQRLLWRDRMAQTAIKAMGVLAGSAGASPLVMVFVSEDETVKFGFTEAVALFGGVCAVVNTLLAVQQYGRRIDLHTRTAGECAKFLNKLDGMFMDAKNDEHDISEELTELEAMKNDIETTAPPL